MDGPKNENSKLDIIIKISNICGSKKNYKTMKEYTMGKISENYTTVEILVKQIHEDSDN